MNQLNFHHFPILPTERLYLRQLKAADSTAIYQLRSNRLINKYINRPLLEKQEEANEFIQNINHGIKNNQWIYWGIALKEREELIGTICLWNFSNENRIADIGYELDPDFQGKGYMSEAVKAVIQYGFKQLFLEVIEAHTDRENLASKNLLLKNDFILNPNRVEEEDENYVIFELKPK